MRTYLNKQCLKCNIKFNTRPAYNKDYCVKCTNAIRMNILYKKLHTNRRTVYVSGNEKESSKQWAIRNRERTRLAKLDYRYKKNVIFVFSHL
jgi:hypothetical protein